MWTGVHRRKMQKNPMTIWKCFPLYCSNQGYKIQDEYMIFFNLSHRQTLKNSICYNLAKVKV